ncbi:MAG: cation transporter [Acidobacteria bacterium]|nr:cation transporter [Acidobacteriota bacterium]
MVAGAAGSLAARRTVLCYGEGLNPDRLQAGRRIALLSVLVSAALAAAKISIGWLAGSTAVMADGFESAGDVLASGIVVFGFVAASKPPDAEHPYGHGRAEMLTGLAVGVILGLAGVGICARSLVRAFEHYPAPAAFGMWPLAASILAKSVLSAVKFRYGRRIDSAALTADAWNDLVDILSGLTAMTALGLTVYDPGRFLAADAWGGFGVGLIVIFVGLNVVRGTSWQLMDTMPSESLMERVRQAALEVPGVRDVEKCYARKTGLQYHVDLHLGVDPEITVRASHEIARQVRVRLRRQLEWVADVLVHVEPSPWEETTSPPTGPPAPE